MVNKARNVLNGATAESIPGHDTFASVVRQELIRIMLLHAAMNKLDGLSRWQLTLVGSDTLGYDSTTAGPETCIDTDRISQMDTITNNF